MGAWIEIPLDILYTSLLDVAPHMGAWIEIILSATSKGITSSHPTWVRGLKYKQYKFIR